MNPILGKLFGKAGKTLVDSVGNALDGLKTSKEEKEAAKLAIQQEINRNIEALNDDANKELEIYMADTANSRDANVKIQESDKASWLSKNTGYILDLFITVIWASLTFYIAGKYLSIITVSHTVNFDGVWGLYAAVTGTMTTIVGWHRGSSRGAEETSNGQRRLFIKKAV
jgi:hypothetical protein